MEFQVQGGTTPVVAALAAGEQIGSGAGELAAVGVGAAILGELLEK